MRNALVGAPAQEPANVAIDAGRYSLPTAGPPRVIRSETLRFALGLFCVLPPQQRFPGRSRLLVPPPPAAASMLLPVRPSAQPQRTSAVAQESPAPKPAVAMTSPGFTFPRRTASSSASGMLAALVLPYRAMLLTTRSCAMSNRCATASRMRWFAWCITSQSIAVASFPAFSSVRVSDAGTDRTANLNTSCPFMFIFAYAAACAHANASVAKHSGSEFCTSREPWQLCCLSLSGEGEQSLQGGRTEPGGRRSGWRAAAAHGRGAVAVRLVRPLPAERRRQVLVPRSVAVQVEPHHAALSLVRLGRDREARGGTDERGQQAFMRCESRRPSAVFHR